MPGGLELPDKPPKHQGGGGQGGGSGKTIPWNGKAYGYGTIQVPAAADKNNDGKIDIGEINAYISANPDWATKAFGSGDGGSGSGSGGSSSSGGSSGGGSAPPDPDAPLISAMSSKYFQMWGEPAPSGLIDKLVKNENLNIWQAEDLWRHDPAWMKTQAARDQADSSFVSALHQIGAA